MFRFERLDVWQKARRYSREIYQLSKTFPVDERFGLTSQLRRAAVSISSNIAEGSGRNAPGDYIRFLDIAYGSLMEVVSQLHLAKDEQLVSDEQFQQAYSAAEEIARMLTGLRQSLKVRKDSNNV